MSFQHHVESVVMQPGSHKKQLQACLDDMSQEGWELVSTERESADGQTVFFLFFKNAIVY